MRKHTRILASTAFLCAAVFAVQPALAVSMDVGEVDGDFGVAVAPFGEAKAEKAVEAFG